VYLLWRGVCSGLLSSFESGCSFSYCWVLRVLFIFWRTVLYHICLLQIIANILQIKSVAYLLILLIESFTEQKFLILMNPSFQFFHESYLCGSNCIIISWEAYNLQGQNLFYYYLLVLSLIFPPLYSGRIVWLVFTFHQLLFFWVKSIHLPPSIFFIQHLGFSSFWILYSTQIIPFAWKTFMESNFLFFFIGI